MNYKDRAKSQYWLKEVARIPLNGEDILTDIDVWLITFLADLWTNNLISSNELVKKNVFVRHWYDRVIEYINTEHDIVHSLKPDERRSFFDAYSTEALRLRTAFEEEWDMMLQVCEKFKDHLKGRGQLTNAVNFDDVLYSFYDEFYELIPDDSFHEHRKAFKQMTLGSYASARVHLWMAFTPKDPMRIWEPSKNQTICPPHSWVQDIREPRLLICDTCSHQKYISQLELSTGAVGA